MLARIAIFSTKICFFTLHMGLPSITTRDPCPPLIYGKSGYMFGSYKLLLKNFVPTKKKQTQKGNFSWSEEKNEISSECYVRMIRYQNFKLYVPKPEKSWKIAFSVFYIILFLVGRNHDFSSVRKKLNKLRKKKIN